MTSSTFAAATLSQILQKGYNDLAELRRMAFTVGAEHYLFQQETPDGFIREWISFLQTRQWLGCLVDYLKQDSPQNIGLTDELASLPCPTLVKVQIILTNDICLENWSEKRQKLAAVLGLPATQPTFVAAVWNPVRLLLVVPQEQLSIFQIICKRGEYGSELLSVAPYKLLSEPAQNTWRIVAWQHPFRLSNNVLTPTITWQEALLTAVQNPPTPSSIPPNEPTPAPPPTPPPTTAQSDEPFPPPPVIPPTSAPIHQPPRVGKDAPKPSSVKDTPLPIINLDKEEATQSPSPSDVEKKE